jgi:hypothetical protein
MTNKEALKLKVGSMICDTTNGHICIITEVTTLNPKEYACKGKKVNRIKGFNTTVDYWFTFNTDYKHDNITLLVE